MQPTLEEKYLMCFSGLLALINKTENHQVYITNADLLAAGLCHMVARPYADGVIIESTPGQQPPETTVILKPGDA